MRKVMRIPPFSEAVTAARRTGRALWAAVDRVLPELPVAAVKAAPAPVAMRVALTLLAAAVLVSGCGKRFTDVEMHLGEEEKVRPYAVLCDPPEAAPGEEVVVTLLCWAPDPGALTVRWQAALDYDPGRYGADAVERHIVDLDQALGIPRPADTGFGFLSQTFRFTVPDSALLRSSAVPSPLRDPSVIALAGLVLPPGSDPTSRDAVEAYLASLSASAIDSLGPDRQAAVLALADRFACSIRFRARLQTGNVVEVTRCLTIRHSARLGSPNANRNPEIARLEVIAIPHPEVEDPEDPKYQSEIRHFPFGNPSGAPGFGGASGALGAALGSAAGAPAASPAEPVQVRVPRHADWTYYLVMTPELQQYTSPYSGERRFTETAGYRWYYFRPDAPSDGYELFRDDPGDPTEMWALDESVRLIPPPDSGETRYRVIGCLRDERPEWALYQATPGLTVAVGEIVFVPPEED